VSELRVLKGHGTENDFVLVPDLDGDLDLTPALARALCDRHAGVGGDGVIRVVRTENAPDVKRLASEAPFFMDYRNADGSLAEMCGNGARVFVRYLQREGLVGSEIAIATRAGIRRAQLRDDGRISVDMGHPELLSSRPVVSLRAAQPWFAATAGRPVLMPNPHVVVPVSNRTTLERLDLTEPPVVTPAMADGQNVEFVVAVAARHLALRVHERGVGETRSCGTGICAAVAAAGAPDGGRWQVDVPGGTAEVTWQADGTIELCGDAVLVGVVDMDASWLASVPESVRPVRGSHVTMDGR
jgi:diaminopimelate epimerase